MLHWTEGTLISMYVWQWQIKTYISTNFMKIDHGGHQIFHISEKNILSYLKSTCELFFLPRGIILGKKYLICRKLSLYLCTSLVFGVAFFLCQCLLWLLMYIILIYLKFLFKIPLSFFLLLISSSCSSWFFFSRF